jgi:hypothetical protein
MLNNTNGSLCLVLNSGGSKDINGHEEDDEQNDDVKMKIMRMMLTVGFDRLSH